MKKRSAMAIAAGLVAALLTGAVALSLGLSGTPTADATDDRVKPRVRTIHETVTVHREAKTQEPETVTIVTAGASSPASAEISDDGGVQDELEGEGFEDEQDSEEHEDGDSGEDD
jgi:hypothetical protein